MKPTNKKIEKKKEKLKRKRQELLENQLNALKELLPNSLIEDICFECGYQYRRRLISPPVTVFHMLGAAISQESSFQSAWHQAGEAGQSGTLSKARNRLPLKVWQELDRSVCQQIQEEFQRIDKWRGHRLIGIDGSGVSMSDEEPLSRSFGKTNSKHGLSRFPIARVAFAFTLSSLMTVSHRIERFRVAEQELFQRIATEDLLPGDLLIGDRHLAGANYYIDYLRGGLDFITPAHQCLKLERLKILKELSSNDFLRELPVGKEHRKQDPSLPEFMIVRTIKVTCHIRGKKKVFWLITSLLNPVKYPAHEIRQLYKRRWKVETLIEEIKLWLGADVLRSKTPEGIRKEFLARIVAFNLIHWLILKAAKKHKQKPERMSTSATLRLVVAYSLKMSTAPAWSLWSLYEELLEKIATSKVPYRPGRTEPRLKKRDQKHYPILKIPRVEWKRINHIAA